MPIYRAALSRVGGKLVIAVILLLAIIFLMQVIRQFGEVESLRTEVARLEGGDAGKMIAAVELDTAIAAGNVADLAQKVAEVEEKVDKLLVSLRIGDLDEVISFAQLLKEWSERKELEKGRDEKVTEVLRKADELNRETTKAIADAKIGSSDKNANFYLWLLGGAGAIILSLFGIIGGMLKINKSNTKQIKDISDELANVTALIKRQQFSATLATPLPSLPQIR